MNYRNDHLKIIEEEYESKFDDYRNIDVEGMEKFIIKKLGELPIHKLLQQLSLVDLLWGYDCVSLYSSAMWDKNSKYPRIETGYVFTKDMNAELVEKFNSVDFTQGSAILKIKYYNPKNLIVQHLPVKEREKKIEIIRMRNGYIVQTLTSVDIQEIVKIGGRVIQINEGVIYRENFKKSPFKKVIEELFALRQKYKEEGKNIMQLLIKLIMNRLYGEFLRKDILESYECKSEAWMMSEYGERVLDNQKIKDGYYIVKLKDDSRLEDKVKKNQHIAHTISCFYSIK